MAEVVAQRVITYAIHLPDQEALVLAELLGKMTPSACAEALGIPANSPGVAVALRVCNEIRLGIMGVRR